MIRVGVVDDQPLLVAAFQSLVDAQPDLTVTGVGANGQDAITLAQAGDVDVLLLDIRMPGMDGLATLEALAGRAPRPKVIVLTTFSTDDYVVRALRLGADGFLLKDADPARLTDAVRRVHAGEPSLSPEVTNTLIQVAVDKPAVDPEAAAAYARLTAREREVAVLMADGLTNAQIGTRLGVSMASVKAHLSTIFAKLGVDNRVSAAMRVRAAGG